MQKDTTRDPIILNTEDILPITNGGSSNGAGRRAVMSTTIIVVPFVDIITGDIQGTAGTGWKGSGWDPGGRSPFLVEEDGNPFPVPAIDDILQGPEMVPSRGMFFDLIKKLMGVGRKGRDGFPQGHESSGKIRVREG